MLKYLNICSPVNESVLKGIGTFKRKWVTVGGPRGLLKKAVCWFWLLSPKIITQKLY